MKKYNKKVGHGKSKSKEEKKKKFKHEEAGDEDEEEEEEKKIYCGVAETPPPGYVMGSMKECAEKKQIRRYGRFKADKHIINLQLGIKEKEEREAQKKEKKEILRKERKERKEILKEEKKIQELKDELESLKQQTESNKIEFFDRMDTLIKSKTFFTKQDKKDVKALEKHFTKKFKNMEKLNEKIKNMEKKLIIKKIK